MARAMLCAADQIMVHAPDRPLSTRTTARVVAAVAWGSSLVLLAPRAAHASLLSPELEDKLAAILALFILFIVPVVLIVLFWMVHVLPEKIAHRREHPQFEAIRTLCLLSLVFGGLLWPIAWVWAYTKPVLHKLAYGSDTLRHTAGDGHAHDGAGARLREKLAQLEQRIPAAELSALQADVDALEASRVNGEGR